MFDDATSFNQKLCEWLDNPNFPNSINTRYMFWASRCDVTGGEYGPTNSAVCQSCESN